MAVFSPTNVIVPRGRKVTTQLFRYNARLSNAYLRRA